MAQGKAVNIYLTAEDKELIRRIISKDYAKYPATIVARCRALDALDLSEGYKRTRKEVADIAKVTVQTVSKLAKIYAENGITAAITLDRHNNSDVSRLKVDGATEVLIIALACSEPPNDRTRWTVRLLAERIYADFQIGLSHTTISTVLKTNDLKPHLKDCWCIPPGANGDFVAHMDRVIRTYQRDYNPSWPVICLDEKPFQLHLDARPSIPPDCGSNKKVDSEYVRNGTCSIFTMIEPHTGYIYLEVRERRTKLDFAYVVKNILENIYPNAEMITLVCDNLNTHNEGSLYEALGMTNARELASRLEFVWTPKHGSWLDIAEIAINIVTTQCLRDRAFKDYHEVSEVLTVWMNNHNQMKKAINWQFTLEKAGTKLRHLYPEIKPDPELSPKEDTDKEPETGADAQEADDLKRKSDSPEATPVDTNNVSYSCTITSPDGSTVTVDKTKDGKIRRRRV